MSVIKQAELKTGPAPWVASVVVEWDTVECGWSRRSRTRKIKRIMKNIEVDQYQTRYDNIIDTTIIYFKNREDAVSVYFYIS